MGTVTTDIFKNTLKEKIRGLRWQKGFQKRQKLRLKILDGNIGYDNQNEEQKRKNGRKETKGYGTGPCGQCTFHNSRNVQLQQIVKG